MIPTPIAEDAASVRLGVPKVGVGGCPSASIAGEHTRRVGFFGHCHGRHDTPIEGMVSGVPLVLEFCAGAGGASLGIHRAIPDTTVVGVEWWDKACATRTKAGLLTVRADVTTFPVTHLRGRLDGFWCSPSCRMWSQAGHGSGRDSAALFGAALIDACRGVDRRAEIRAAAARALIHVVAARWRKNHKAVRSDHLRRVARAEAFDAALVLEPARVAFEARPRWIVCEQVPDVLPVWRALAYGLSEHLGYSTWVGTLDAASFGVPQHRKRAILMASLDRVVHPPEATHAPRGDHRLGGGDLFGGTVERQVSMADALGWGALERPYVTVAVGHSDAAGAGGGTPERASSVNGNGRGRTVRTGHGQAPDFDPEEGPARTVVRAAKDWHRDP